MNIILLIGALLTAEDMRYRTLPDFHVYYRDSIEASGGDLNTIDWSADELRVAQAAYYIANGFASACSYIGYITRWLPYISPAIDDTIMLLFVTQHFVDKDGFDRPNMSCAAYIAMIAHKW